MASPPSGNSVAEAYDLLYYTERVAQVQLLAMSSGRQLKFLSPGCDRHDLRGVSRRWDVWRAAAVSVALRCAEAATRQAGAGLYTKTDTRRRKFRASVIPANLSVIPANPCVIPAKAGTQRWVPALADNPRVTFYRAARQPYRELAVLADFAVDRDGCRRAAA